MRKKTVSYDGVTLTISPLSLSQTEELLAPLDPETSWREHQINCVLSGLNNAIDDPNAPSWTRRRIGDEFDMQLLNLVFNDILAFSGLKLEPAKEARPLEELAPAGALVK